MFESTILPAIVAAVVALLFRAIEGTVTRIVSKKDEKEAQRQETYERLCEVTFETRNLSVQYWELAGDVEGQRRRQAAIIGRLTFILAVIDDLFRHDGGAKKEISSEVKRFHEACSGGEFGVKDRVENPNRIQDIEISTYSLVHCVQVLLRKKRYC